LQVCVAEAFNNYLKLKSKLTADGTIDLFLEAWEVEAVRGKLFLYLVFKLK